MSLIKDNVVMEYEIETTPVFDKWLKNLKDPMNKARILARLDRVENGNFGDVKTIDSQISEMRFFFGGGFRIYYTMNGTKIVILLTGGDKSTQQQDINKAKMILDELEF
jgi:putative addiction module killer protein